MNGKPILMFMVFINIFAVIVGLAMASAGNTEMPQQNFILSLFIPDSQMAIVNITSTEQLLLSQNFSGVANNMTTQEGGSFVSGTSGISFLDGIKMVIGVISLITPIPIFAFVFSAGFPLIITISIILPLFILYIISLAEWIRGASL